MSGLFCCVFKKIFVDTYRFPVVFARPHYNADQERSHMVASVRHFRYSRSRGLAPGRVYLMTSPFSVSIVFSVHTRKQRFQKASFSNRSTPESVFEWLRFFGDHFRRCSVDDSRIRSKTAPFSFENGLVCTGPQPNIDH